jgi:AraC-like DNA-binding protein
VNRADHQSSFSISRMEDIYAKRGGQQDLPHRHDYFTVILIKNAKGQHIVDFNEYHLQANQVFFITPGQVHQVMEKEQSYGYAITFSQAFLAHNNIPLEFIEHLNLFRDFGSTAPLLLKEDQMTILNHYTEEMIKSYESDMSLKYDALGALLKLLLIQCNNFCTNYGSEQIMIDQAHRLLHTFKSLLNQHYKEWHTVTEYALKLNVSADHLNRVIKSLTGKKAKDHIQSRLTVAAKRLLYFSDMSNKELAYELGFSEPANFSAFFKKCTGISPSQFQKNHDL